MNELVNYTRKQDVQLGPYTFTLVGGCPEADLRRERFLRREDYSFIFDILACTAAIDGDPRHPLLRRFNANQRTWRQWVGDRGTDFLLQDLTDAAIANHLLNLHWYGLPQYLYDTLKSYEESGYPELDPEEEQRLLQGLD